MKVWDLRSLLTMDIRDNCPPHISSTNLPLKAIPPPSHSLNSTKLVSADEFQFVTVDTDDHQIDDNEKKNYFLSVKSFLGKMGSK